MLIGYTNPFCYLLFFIFLKFCLKPHELISAILDKKGRGLDVRKPFKFQFLRWPKKGKTPLNWYGSSCHAEGIHMGTSVAGELFCTGQLRNSGQKGPDVCPVLGFFLCSLGSVLCSYNWMVGAGYVGSLKLADLCLIHRSILRV